jgi:hypothetical protein
MKMCDYRRVFGLATGFIGLFDTACDYTLQCPVTHTHQCTVTSSFSLLGSGFQGLKFPEGCACDVCDRPHLPSPWHSYLGDYSPTAPAAPSKCTTIIIFSEGCALDVSSFVSEGPIPPQCPVTRSPVEDQIIRFPISSSAVFLQILPEVLSFLRRSCRLEP